MANPNRTDYEGPPLTGEGILWINARLTDPAALPPDRFARWYEDVHIPDILAAGDPPGITAAWRYRCVDAARPAPLLTIYRCPDLGFVQTAAFRALPMTHASLPGGGPVHRFADFDARFLRHEASWAAAGADETTAGALLLVSEAIAPAAALPPAALAAWFRDVHVPEVAALPGWRRSSRFTLVFHKADRDAPPPRPGAAGTATPTLLALHAFAAAADGAAAAGRDGAPFPPHAAPATLAILAAARTVDVAAFRLLRGFGAAAAPWAGAPAAPVVSRT